jgi:spermidine synthase
VVSPNTRLLVLGSFPSVASLAAQQYYGHPRNQFWPLLAALVGGRPLADWTYAQRLAFVREHGLGIWDVYARCRRRGSLDVDIRDAEPNDLAGLAGHAAAAGAHRPQRRRVGARHAHHARARRAGAAPAVHQPGQCQLVVRAQVRGLAPGLRGGRAAVALAAMPARRRATPAASPDPMPALPPVTLSEYEGVRYLHLGSIWVQGAMRLRKPDVIELDYVQRMLASLLWLPDGRAGAGAGGAAGPGRRRHHALHPWPAGHAHDGGGDQPAGHRRQPPVVPPARRRPAAAGAAHATRCTGCDRRPNPAACELLHVDLYDEEAAAPVLDDEAFYAACRRVLAPGGSDGVNLFGRHASFAASAARIAAAFGAARCGACAPRARATPWWWPGRAWWCRPERSCCSAPPTSNSAGAAWA